MDLAQVITPVRTDDRWFSFDVPVGWAQGRGAFGGLVLGAMLRAMQASEPATERRLRSLAGELVGPVVPGASTIEVVVLRRGNGVSTLEALLRQGGEVLARATAVLGKSRDIDRRWSPPDRAAATPWIDVVPVPVGLPFVPEFSRHFEYRITGPAPFSGAR